MQVRTEELCLPEINGLARPRGFVRRVVNFDHRQVDRKRREPRRNNHGRKQKDSENRSAKDAHNSIGASAGILMLRSPRGSEEH